MTPPTAALPPCPLCGSTELTQGPTVAHENTSCKRCYCEAPTKAWVNRAPAVQATADADGLAREIVELGLAVVDDTHNKESAIASVAAIIRKAVSLKAAPK